MLNHEIVEMAEASIPCVLAASFHPEDIEEGK
jgi:hypothetical protein